MKIFLFVALLVATSAQALDIGPIGVSAGIRRNTAQADFGDEDPGLSIDFGVIKKFYMQEDLIFRTGLKMTQRYFEISDSDFEYAYLDIPLALEYTVNARWSSFFGFVIATNLSDTTEASPAPDASPFLTQLLFGGKYSINRRLQMEGTIELGMSEVADSIDDVNSFGINLVYWFE